jgi:hypothetical protein
MMQTSGVAEVVLEKRHKASNIHRSVLDELLEFGVTENVGYGRQPNDGILPGSAPLDISVEDTKRLNCSSLELGK